MARLEIHGVGVELDKLRDVKSEDELRDMEIFSHLEDDKQDEAYKILLASLKKDVEEDLSKEDEESEE